MTDPTRCADDAPLPVDWLPLETLASDASLGLCMLPGRRGAGADGRVWARELSADLDTLRTRHRADRLICLVEEHELRAYGVPTLPADAAAAGLAFTHHPIADGTVPRGGPPELEALIVKIVLWLRAGERIVVHCVAGIGRSGTVAGCVLVALGQSPDDALALLAQTRGPSCPETPAQRWFVGAYADEVGCAES